MIYQTGQNRRCVKILITVTPKVKTAMCKLPADHRQVIVSYPNEFYFSHEGQRDHNIDTAAVKLLTAIVGYALARCPNRYERSCTLF